MRLPRDGVTAELRMDLPIPQLGIVPTAAALCAIRIALSPNWMLITEAPQDGVRLMFWDSVSKRAVLGSWWGDNLRITHYAAEPVGPEFD